MDLDTGGIPDLGSLMSDILEVIFDSGGIP